jgi:hypothetical protein
MATLAQDNLVYHFMKPALVKVLQGFRAGNKGTELGKCNRASREPKWLLNSGSGLVSVCSGRNQAVLKMLTPAQAKTATAHVTSID